MTVHATSFPEVLIEAAKGNVSLDYAQAHLDRYLHSFEQIEQGFQRSLEAQPAEILEQCESEAQAVRDALQQLRSLAEEIGRSLASPQPEALRALGDNLRALTHDSNEALGRYREACLQALGPTRLAGANLLTRTVNFLLENPAEPGATHLLGDQLEAELSRIEQALSQPDYPELLQAAMAAYQEALLGLQQASQSGDLDALEQTLEHLLVQAEQLEDAMDAAQGQQGLTHGSSPYARLNLIGNLAQQVLTGEADLGMLLDQCQGLQQNVTLWRTQFGAILRKLQTEPSPLVLRQGQLLDQAYETFDQQLVHFFQTVESHHADAQELDVAPLLTSLSQAWDQVVGAQRELESLGENQGKIPCVRCGHYNRSDFRSCSQCGAILPKVAEERTHSLDLQSHAVPQESSAPTTEMTENLRRIFSAVDQFTGGQIDLDQFQGEVAWMHGLLEQARQAVPTPTEAPVESEAHSDGEGAELDESTRAAVLFLQGIQEIEAGLGFLEQITEPSETDTAQAGATLIWEGSGKLQQALKLSS